MKHVFLTGMIRSGTTLLEKLLSNHKDMSMLSQPFPQVFIGIKRKFHDKIKHPESYYVLNNFVNEDLYHIGDFTAYLSSKDISRVEINQYLSQKYSGQLTEINNNINIQESGKLFAQWYKQLVFSQRHTQDVTYCGSKEVICEEFVPYLTDAGIRAIIIIRDPRDVMASIHHGKSSEYVGDHRPLLFDLQNWRKSFYFALGNTEKDYFHYLKYEDLVSEPIETLNKITKFLDVDMFTEQSFYDGIYSQDNRLWNGNSSFNLDGIVSKKNVGKYRNILDNKTINFIEATCFKEMNFLGYTTNVEHTQLEKIILNFNEPYAIKNTTLQQKYSRTGTMRTLEVDRLYGQHTNSYIYENNISKLELNHG